VDRYGIEEVSRWYFEVWNEPNLDFWAGKPAEETYYKLYDVTALALKNVNARLRVGGPATAQAAWVDRFVHHDVENHIPVDFVSTHVYGNDSAKDVFGTDEIIPRTQMVCRAARKVHDQVAASLRPDLPIIWSEYNASYKNETAVTDSVFMGPWLADTIRQCDGLTEMMAYWTFSDVFEEQGVVKQPFYGGFGLIAEDGLPKPSFNAFKLLHRLGENRLPVNSDSAIVTRRSDGAIVMAVWNLALPDENGQPKKVTFVLKGFPGRHQAALYRLDATHGSLTAAYDKLGRPQYPTQAQIALLRRAGEIPPPESLRLENGKFTIALPPQGLALIELR
jgi:xylan 1,4-beta-xylosidase